MPRSLDIVIRQTNVIPASNVTFRYPTAVTSDVDVDQAGEYHIDGMTLYLALTDADAKPLVALPVGTMLEFMGRNPFNSPITQDVSVTSYTATATRATVGLAATPITSRGTLGFTAALPGSSDTKQFWAKRLDFSASYLAAQVGLGLVATTDTRYRVRPDPAWVLAATFEDEKGDERTVTTVSQTEDRKYLELLASRVAG